MRTVDEWARAAVRRGHKRLTTATLWHPTGKVGDIPIAGGNASWNLAGGAGQRTGQLTTAGAEWAELLSPGAGAWVELTAAIDSREWALGQWPVTETTEQNPGGRVVATLGDWAGRRAAWQAEATFTMTAGQKLAALVATHLTAAMDRPVTVTEDATNGGVLPTDIEVRIGGNVWAALTQAANTLGVYLTQLSRDTAAIRRVDPYAPYHDDITGTVVDQKRTYDLDGAVNRVIAVVEGSATDAPTYRAVRSITGGPWRYGGPAGRHVLTDVQRVDTPTQLLADTNAQRLADRRFGIVKRLDISVIAQPWIEIGDVLVVRFDKETDLEYAMVETVSWPFDANGTMKITTRGVEV